MAYFSRIALPALLTACALFGQKIHPRLEAQAEPGARLQVLIVLRHQPQAEIVARAEGAAALRTGILEGEWLKLSGRRYAPAEQLREARERLDAAVVETRQAALREIRDATVIEQQAVQSRLAGLGATNVHGYAVLNAVAAEAPAEALAALAADAEVAEIVPVEWHEGLLDVSSPALGAPAYWSRGITGAGESVAVLDSGVRSSHPAFAGMNVVGRVFGRYASQSNCFADNAQSAEDLNGHGSHVAGIVAGQGAPGAPYVGVARGLGTLYNLKIGFSQKDIQGQCGGKVSSNTADALEALEWALFNTPVKIFNYSYGGTAQSDDTPSARVFDYLADVYGVTITVAAGNDGPAASTLNSPGIAYNVITVANYDDRGTIDRGDDLAAPSSSRGPVSGGRFKPDVAAPGSRIISAAHDADVFVSKTGTSMAAPHIAGAAALMRQAGLTDALALKAVLINTADGTGWNGAGGWGYANLNAAAARPYFLRGQAAPAAATFFRGRTAADFKATLVWNRHVSDPGSYARSMFANLGLYLYSRGNGTLLDASESAANNVQQVATAAGGEAVLKVRAGTFPQGVTAEAYAVGISEAGFVKAEPPSLEIRCTAPATVGASSSFSVSCEAANNGELDALAASAEMTVPRGFAGSGAASFGTIAGGSRVTRVLNLTAPGVAGAYTAPLTLKSSAWGETFKAGTSVALNVSAGPVTAPPLVVSASALSFTYRAGQPAPAASTVTLSCTGAAFPFKAGSSASWLRVTPSAGSTPATISVSVEPGNLAPGSYTGTVTVEAAGAANSPQTIAVTLAVEGAAPASLAVRSRLMTATVPQGGGCAAPPTVESFQPTAPSAYVWFYVGGAAAGDRGSLKWYAPDGSLYESGQWDAVASAGAWCFWSALDIAGRPPATTPGRWTVQVFWNGAPLFSLPFTIAEAVTVEARMMTRSLAESSPCNLPKPSDTFATTDPQALAWFFVNNGKAGDVPSMKWFQPDGTVFRSRVWEPMEASGKWCFWDSLEIQGTKAAAQPGTWTVKAAWNGNPLFTLTFTLAPPVVVEQKVMTRSLAAGGGCVEPERVPVFAPTDARAYLWLSLSGTKTDDRPKAEWYAPSGELYATVNWDPLTSGGNWCLWGWINVAGQPAAGMFGEWKVKFYWNGAEMFTESFQMAPVLVQNRLMSKETPESGSCAAPPPASAFLTTDARAVLWFYVRARAEDKARVEWVNPAGETYRRGEWDPVPGDSNRCYWSTMSIAGAPPAGMPGAWTVRVYWNETVLFSQQFNIETPAAEQRAAPATGQARAAEEAGPEAGEEGQTYCGPLETGEPI